MAPPLFFQALPRFFFLPRAPCPHSPIPPSQTKTFWHPNRWAKVAGGPSGPPPGTSPRPPHAPSPFKPSVPSPRPPPPFRFFDDKDSSACRLIISPPVMTTGSFTRLRGAGAE